MSQKAAPCTTLVIASSLIFKISPTIQVQSHPTVAGCARFSVPWLCPFTSIWPAKAKIPGLLIPVCPHTGYRLAFEVWLLQSVSGLLKNCPSLP